MESQKPVSNLETELQLCTNVEFKMLSKHELFVF